MERHDGANESRLHHILQSIMRPMAFPHDAGGFDTALHLVQRWEILASDLLNDAVSDTTSSQDHI